MMIDLGNANFSKNSGSRQVKQNELSTEDNPGESGKGIGHVVAVLRACFHRGDSPDLVFAFLDIFCRDFPLHIMLVCNELDWNGLSPLFFHVLCPKFRDLGKRLFSRHVTHDQRAYRPFLVMLTEFIPPIFIPSFLSGSIPTHESDFVTINIELLDE